ncbi:hypothetical protein F2Q69_00035521 [Brassica cretica]|uniref:Uncharacterized protein n=1 Tax=Brassica cretica TaxID=69181 RepID=A0A8S9SQD4_BRACR|nr:hypothetical protein F2Q69_00035521 [Brassica cretica]
MHLFFFQSVNLHSAAINRIEYASLLLQKSKAGRCTRRGVAAEKLRIHIWLFDRKDLKTEEIINKLRIHIWLFDRKDLKTEEIINGLGLDARISYIDGAYDTFQLATLSYMLI